MIVSQPKELKKYSIRKGKKYSENFDFGIKTKREPISMCNAILDLLWTRLQIWCFSIEMVIFKDSIARFIFTGLKHFDMVSIGTNTNSLTPRNCMKVNLKNLMR
jgi:hypothetical protein